MNYSESAASTSEGLQAPANRSMVVLGGLESLQILRDSGLLPPNDVTSPSVLSKEKNVDTVVVVGRSKCATIREPTPFSTYQ